MTTRPPYPLRYASEGSPPEFTWVRIDYEPPTHRVSFARYHMHPSLYKSENQAVTVAQPSDLTSFSRSSPPLQKPPSVFLALTPPRSKQAPETFDELHNHEHLAGERGEATIGQIKTREGRKEDPPTPVKGTGVGGCHRRVRV
ncbi:hypothetical protein YC2023_036374 [Brassica napus]|uniref:(rape) hypothetical protein n=1 Tax=Brassica napus TaxID=3708 RepID=A0A816IB32_BRANA|nr:unnamed protein product [Brassica napus]